MAGALSQIIGKTLAPVALPLMRSLWPSDKYLWPVALMQGSARSDAAQEVWSATPDGIQLLLRPGIYPDCAMLYGVFEIKTVQLMRSLLKQGDTVIDVGANGGWFSLLTAKIVGPSGKVHAFEPLPQNQRRLQANMDKNGLKNISLHPVGAGEADGEFEFYSFENDMLASLRPVMEGGTKIKCQVRTLDQELRDVQSCKVFKIDIEGAEAMALRGGTDFIRRTKPHIVVEFNVDALKAFGESPASITKLIRSIDSAYEPFTIDGFSHKPITQSRIDTWNNRIYENVWFKPKGS